MAVVVAVLHSAAPSRAADATTITFVAELQKCVPAEISKVLFYSWSSNWGSEFFGGVRISFPDPSSVAVAETYEKNPSGSLAMDYPDVNLVKLISNQLLDLLGFALGILRLNVFKFILGLNNFNEWRFENDFLWYIHIRKITLCLGSFFQFSRYLQLAKALQESPWGILDAFTAQRVALSALGALGFLSAAANGRTREICLWVFESRESKKLAVKTFCEKVGKRAHERVTVYLAVNISIQICKVVVSKGKVSWRVPI